MGSLGSRVGSGVSASQAWPPSGMRAPPCERVSGVWSCRGTRIDLPIIAHPWSARHAQRIARLDPGVPVLWKPPASIVCHRRRSSASRSTIPFCRCNCYVDNALVCKPMGYCSQEATRIGVQSLTPVPFYTSDAESARWPVPASTRLIPRRPCGIASGWHDRRAPGALEARRRQRS